MPKDRMQQNHQQPSRGHDHPMVISDKTPPPSWQIGKTTQTELAIRPNYEHPLVTPTPIPTPRRPAPRIRLPLRVAVAIYCLIGAITLLLVFRLGVWIFNPSELSTQPNPTETDSSAAAATQNSGNYPDAEQTLKPAEVEPETPSMPQISNSWPPPIQQWQTEIGVAAAKYSLPADLIAAVLWHESTGNPNGISYAGAVGLMGVMPFESGIASRPTTAELLDPATNLEWGAKILQENILRADGDLRHALGAYVAGWGYYNSADAQAYANNVLTMYWDMVDDPQSSAETSTP